MFLFNSQSDVAMEYWEQILQFTWGFHLPNFEHSDFYWCFYKALLSVHIIWAHTQCTPNFHFICLYRHSTNLKNFKVPVHSVFNKDNDTYRISYMPGATPTVFTWINLFNVAVQSLSHLIFRTALREWYYYYLHLQMKWRLLHFN